MRDPARCPTSSNWASAVSTSVRTGAGWPTGDTPPMVWPVAVRTNSGVARLTAVTPSSAATLPVSTRCAPEVSTSRGEPSASNNSELAIWPTSMEERLRPPRAVMTASGSNRIWPVAPAAARLSWTARTLG